MASLSAGYCRAVGKNSSRRHPFKVTINKDVELVYRLTEFLSKWERGQSTYTGNQEVAVERVHYRESGRILLGMGGPGVQ